MKKAKRLLAFLSSLVISAGMITAFPASAINEDDLFKSFYYEYVEELMAEKDISQSDAMKYADELFKDEFLKTGTISDKEINERWNAYKIKYGAEASPDAEKVLSNVYEAVKNGETDLIGTIALTDGYSAEAAAEKLVSELGISPDQIRAYDKWYLDKSIIEISASPETLIKAGGLSFVKSVGCRRNEFTGKVHSSVLGDIKAGRKSIPVEITLEPSSEEIDNVKEFCKALGLEPERVKSDTRYVSVTLIESQITKAEELSFVREIACRGYYDSLVTLDTLAPDDYIEEAEAFLQFYDEYTADLRAKGFTDSDTQLIDANTLKTNMFFGGAAADEKDSDCYTSWIAYKNSHKILPEKADSYLLARSRSGFDLNIYTIKIAVNGIGLTDTDYDEIAGQIMSYAGIDAETPFKVSLQRNGSADIILRTDSDCIRKAVKLNIVKSVTSKSVTELMSSDIKRLRSSDSKYMEVCVSFDTNDEIVKRVNELIESYKAELTEQGITGNEFNKLLYDYIVETDEKVSREINSEYIEAVRSELGIQGTELPYGSLLVNINYEQCLKLAAKPYIKTLGYNGPQPLTDEARYGDANSDGTVNIADAVFIMQSLANPSKYAMSSSGIKQADVVDGDGVTAKDALEIQKYLLGLVEIL